MGTLEMVQGDLFTADTDAIAHGCNCRGRMGAGIAALFRKKHPAMFTEYERLCDARTFSLGSVFTWSAGDQARSERMKELTLRAREGDAEAAIQLLSVMSSSDGSEKMVKRAHTIYNLGTQLAPGANAEPRGISIAFKHMADVMWKRSEESVAIPLIGCGIGGLSWHHDVRPFVKNLADRVDVKVYYLNPSDLN